MNLVSKMIANAQGREVDEVETEERKRPNPWYPYRHKAPSPRVFRRLEIRDVLSADRKRQRQSRRRERAIHVITEKEAVRRVREWEAKNGPALTHLLRTGAITEDDLLHGVLMFEIADRLGLLTEVADV